MANRKSTVLHTQKKESKHNTKDSHQITREQEKVYEQKQIQSN